MERYYIVNSCMYGNGEYEILSVWDTKEQKIAYDYLNNLIKENQEDIFDYEENSYIIYNTNKYGDTERIEIIESEL